MLSRFFKMNSEKITEYANILFIAGIGIAIQKYNETYQTGGTDPAKKKPTPLSKDSLYQLPTNRVAFK